MKKLEKLSTFLNSVWLISSVKEWLFRITVIGFLQMLIISGLSIHKNGLTPENITGILISSSIFILIYISFFIFLYREFCLGRLLKNKSELFKN